MNPNPRVVVSVAVLSDQNVLIVRETKPRNFDRWNLPGGHVEQGESIINAALRELREETGLALELQGHLRTYSGPTSVRFVFVAKLAGSAVPIAGDEISEVRMVPIRELAAWPNEELVSAAMLRAILDDLVSGVVYPVTQFVDVAGVSEVRSRR